MISVVGFPRIGQNRELKKWLESYLDKKLSKEELIQNSKNLKKTHWHLQKEYGVDLVPSNDFSFYDTFLDHAMLVGSIPEEYKAVFSDDLELYFALAKGYQDQNIDLKALPMKKWFFTNYHYLVPEINKNTKFELASTKPFDEFVEALSIGIKTKPVIIGALTFMKLSKKSNVDMYDKSLWEKLLDVYIKILKRFEELGSEFIQIDEPILVTDLNAKDIEFFESFYRSLLLQKGEIKVILQTYFGDVRDCFEKIILLDFDAIGLDFVDGKFNLELIKKFGFPQEKLLFAGVVNGRNVFKNNYKNTLELLNMLSSFVDKKNIVISTSCSLLFVPYSLKFETQLDSNKKKFLAFAEEKLKELSELKLLFSQENFTANSIYVQNVQLFEELEKNKLSDVSTAVNNLTDDDFERKPRFEERIKLQKEVLNLPQLPTTTIGSFPQTQDVRSARSKLKKGEITFEEYESFIKSKIERVIKLQEEIGLDVLVHGEYERNDMVEFFGEKLEGFLITQNGWVQSYGTRCVKPPIIFSDIKRKKSLTVEYIKYAQTLTSKPVKGILTGPVTILNWSFVREDIPLKNVAFQLALAIKEEVLELEKEGVKIIQIDEAALIEKLPLRKCYHKDYLDWAIKAFKLTCSKVKPETQIHTHMCYSNFDELLDEIAKMDVDVITFEAAKSDFTLLDSINKSNLKSEVGPGVFDVHSPRIVSKEEIKKLILKMIEKVGKDRLWVNPDCGLKTRKEEEVLPTLQNMVLAVWEIRNNI
ncbi:5-methyltetrahydropteroyltriglutamate/homocysteine S-methyltransferase [Caldicellulosiruptor owensensis OL]|uniref:5-methyltetrahydropteroyltriglutamate--homocysteine S-methyltransferase n=1 Tax=Caldicellulosiruptor owensensis (strain ATCC 700167 / DSM 13100 / OL) TaxID=632518 RepID=E4Q6P4_CALOW|nr:5-methyltetrahydropteroyltriglutamate--homocysteine S-methyltransferase [Caldicellulosiruptor owensensis]ADQ05651.1 5-methyltetrahydropteroyltriglutamate/homocysteine S-methyltransferase [Caldicellulosiruptor owensensis OL]